MQDNLLAFDVERMPGVISALIACDNVSPASNPVNPFALALVPPLGSDHDGDAALMAG